MKEIRYREFIRGFGKVRDGFEKVKVIGKGGVLVGVWTPAGVEDVRHAEASPKVVVSDKVSDKKEVFKKLMGEIDIRAMANMPPLTGVPQDLPAAPEGWEPGVLMDEEVPVMELFMELCMKCGKEEVAWKGVNYEVDPDGVAMRICGKCYRKAGAFGYKRIS
jgi:hypothetical protein